MKPKNLFPPRWMDFILRSFCSAEVLETLQGDLIELYQLRRSEKGRFIANLYYLTDIFSSFRSFALRRRSTTHWSNSNLISMFQHYFKISWRVLLRHKIFSSIKIGGFAIGIAACILITLYISHETSYDKYYQHTDRIYRIANQWTDGGEVDRWTNLQGPLKEVLEANIPEMEKVARTVFWTWGNAGENHIRKVESTYNTFEKGFIYADPELLEILETPMIYGDQKTALTQPNSMVITQKIADKYYPDEDPVGRQIILNDKKEDTYTIGGVIADFPANSHLQSDFILTLAERKSGPGTSGWCCTNYVFYARLTERSDPRAVEQKLVDTRNTYVMDQLAKVGESGLDLVEKHHSYYLQPIQNVYLNPDEVGDDQQHGSQELIYIFGAIAAIILLLACVNFVNLSTAKSITRAKEVGLRKVVGSVRSGLIQQYLSESFLYSLIAILTGLAIAWIALPYFNEVAGKPLQLPWQAWWFTPMLLTSALLIGILAGIYPAFYLSRFKPVEVLKGHAKNSGKVSLLRNGMVVFQFTATIILIIGALVTHQQFKLVMNKSLGYERKQVVNILGLNSMEETSRESLKNELLKLSEVESASLADYLPVQGGAIQNRTFWIADRRQLDNGLEAARWTVDEDYMQTMDMEIIAGRNFTRMASDDQAAIINETMVKELGIEDPIGLPIIDMFDNTYRVIGVVKDFYFESMLQNVQPLAMFRGKGTGTLSIRIQSQDTEAAISSIEQVWDDFQPNQALRYSFMDQRFASMYDSLSRAKTIFILFATLSIIVACLGLFALSAYMAEQRSKEVSIRKVLGASVSRIFLLLTGSYICLVAIAIALAIPLGWFLMDSFLGDIANRVPLSWTIFALAGLIALLIALITISTESLKVSSSNPASKLRSE